MNLYLMKRLVAAKALMPLNEKVEKNGNGRQLYRAASVLESAAPPVSAQKEIHCGTHDGCEYIEIDCSLVKETLIARLAVCI
jgi:hypothetical protein